MQVRRAKEDQIEHVPEDFWLMGRWDSLVLDPTVWGFGDAPLHLFQVKQARLRCLLLCAADKLGPRFSPSSGVRPAAWPSDEALAPALSNRDAAAQLRLRLREVARAVPSPVPPPPLPADAGLFAHELPWLEAVARKRADERGDRPPGERDAADPSLCGCWPPLLVERGQWGGGARARTTSLVLGPLRTWWTFRGTTRRTRWLSAPTPLLPLSLSGLASARRTSVGCIALLLCASYTGLCSSMVCGTSCMTVCPPLRPCAPTQPACKRRWLRRSLMQSLPALP